MLYYMLHLRNHAAERNVVCIGVNVTWIFLLLEHVQYLQQILCQSNRRPQSRAIGSSQT